MTIRASSSSTIADEIERYLRTGEADMMGNPWPGDIMERGRRQHADIRGALLAEDRWLAKGRTQEAVPGNVGVEFTRAKVEPMGRGLFPKDEQELVLATLERSVVYVTSETIESIIPNHGWDRSAWDLANLFLLSGKNHSDFPLRAMRSPSGPTSAASRTWNFGTARRTATTRSTFGLPLLRRKKRTRPSPTATASTLPHEVPIFH